jgi:hypothetical protein
LLILILTCFLIFIKLLGFINQHKEIGMKNFRLLAVMAVLVMFIGVTTGCDNRSQLEKDADKVAAKVKKAMN